MTVLEALPLSLSVLVGLALAAAAGFRVFVPLLALALAARFGGATLAPELAWLGSTTALVALGVATLVEIGAYHIPWLDHALDVVASPTALVAGAASTAAVLTPDLDPGLRAAIAIVGGGGAALATQASTVTLRAASTATTGGLANPLVATLEAIAAFVLSALAILLPLVAAAGLVLVGFVVVRALRRRAARRAAAEPQRGST